MLKIIIQFLRLDHLKPFVIVLIPSILTALKFGYICLIVPTLLKITLATFFLITGGCIFNDLVDLKYDKQIPRSANRPLASGELNAKYAWLCTPFFTGFILTSQLFEQEVLVQFVVALLLTLLYPFTKRFMHAPQIVLGLVNLSPLITYKEVSLSDQNIPWGMFIGGIALIVLYDTIYAWQDIEYDKHLNLGNLGLHIGERYMPLFIDICSLIIGLCFGYHLGWIALILCLLQGGRVKSKFIKSN